MQAIIYTITVLGFVLVTLGLIFYIAWVGLCRFQAVLDAGAVP